MKKKKIFIIISIVSVFLIAAIFFGGIAIFLNDAVLKNQILIAMPRAIICTYLESNTPIGSDVESVKEFLESNSEWHELNYPSNEYNAYFRNLGSQKRYSFCNYDHTLESTRKTVSASYVIDVDIGTSLGSPFWGDYVHGYFIFDNQNKLVDIVVEKDFIGP